MRYTEDFRYSTILLHEARSVRYNNLVAPGNTLNVSMTVQERRDNRYVFKGSGTVNGHSAVSARLTLEQFNLEEETPHSGDRDRKCIDDMRQLFRQLWSPTPLTSKIT
jgi:3-hydroxyacyl-[acyl-carrier-protein] dehydratase